MNRHLIVQQTLASAVQVYTGRRSVFVDVVAVLVVPVTIVDMVVVITVLHGLAAVTVRVGAFVAGVGLLLGMTLVAVYVVEMVVVLDRFATVSG